MAGRPGLTGAPERDARLLEGPDRAVDVGRGDHHVVDGDHTVRMIPARTFPPARRLRYRELPEAGTLQAPAGHAPAGPSEPDRDAADHTFAADDGEPKLPPQVRWVGDVEGHDRGHGWGP